MSLADRFRAANERTNASKCGVARVRDSLQDSTTEADFDAAIEDLLISGSAISTVMKAEGFELSAFSVRRHRRGECSC